MYKRGKAIGEDFKTNIIQDTVEQGGGSWKCFCQTGETSIKRCSRSIKYLQQAYIEFVTLLKTHRPSMSTGEVLRNVNEHCNVAGGTPKAALGER